MTGFGRQCLIRSFRTSPAPFVHTFPATWSAEKVLRHCGHGIAVHAEANERFAAIAAMVMSTDMAPDST